MDPLSNHMLLKIQAVLDGPQGELFAKIVDSFFEQLEEEYFSEDDLAAMEEGRQASLSGDRSQFISWDEYKARRGL